MTIFSLCFCFSFFCSFCFAFSFLFPSLFLFFFSVFFFFFFFFFFFLPFFFCPVLFFALSPSPLCFPPRRGPPSAHTRAAGEPPHRLPKMDADPAGPPPPAPDPPGDLESRFLKGVAISTWQNSGDGASNWTAFAERTTCCGLRGTVEDGNAGKFPNFWDRWVARRAGARFGRGWHVCGFVR